MNNEKESFFFNKLREHHIRGFPMMAGLALLLFASWVSTARAAQDANRELLDLAESGDIEAMRELLAAKKQVDVNSRDEERWTALMLAAKEGHTTVIEMLLDAGANIYLVNDAKETALHVAAKNRETEGARILLEAGSPLTPRDAEGRTALFRAIEVRHAETIELLQSAAQASVDRVHSTQVNTPPEVTEPARIVSSDPVPPYTDIASKQGIEGTVVIMVLVRRDGSVGGISVSKGLEESLDRSVMQTVRRWEIAPALRGEEPVNAVLEIQIEFKLP